MKIKDVNFVHVPLFDELKPQHVLEKMNLEKNNLKIYEDLLHFCPELKIKKWPKDREFFFNILNSLKFGCIDSIVSKAI